MELTEQQKKLHEKAWKWRQKGYTYKQIARTMSLPESTVNDMVKRWQEIIKQEQEVKG